MSFPDRVPFDSNKQRNASRRQRGGFRVIQGGGGGKEGRTLPHSIEAEEYLLSCCLLDGIDVLGRCEQAGVSEQSFYIAPHGVIFAQLIDMQRRGVSIDVGPLAEELRAAKRLDEVGGIPFIMQVSAKIPTTVQAGYYIEKVRGLEMKRAKIRSLREYLEALDHGDEEQLITCSTALRALEAENSGGLPPVVSWKQLEESAVPTPPEIVAGVLHQGRRMGVVGGSKSFKSWVLLDLALSVATGTPWWGMKTTPGRVLYVNFELPIWGLKARLKDIAAAKKIELSDNLEIWDLDGFGKDLAELMPQFEARMTRVHYTLIILDPIYVCLGDRDENSNGDVTQLMNQLAWLARRTGSAVAFGHHFSKGNQSEKDAKDRASGAGAWVRAPDAVVTLTSHEEENCFTASYVLRSQKQKPEMVVRWNHPCMEVAPGLDPAALKTAGRPKANTASDIVKLIEGRTVSYSQWKALAMDAGVSESTFKRRLEDAIKSGLVVNQMGQYRQKDRE
jgi:hypothetical protein